MIGIRMTLAALACGVGAWAGFYHWASERSDAPRPAARAAHVPYLPQTPRSEPRAQASRPPPMATLPAQHAAGSEPTPAFSRLAVLSMGSPVDAVTVGDVTGDGRDDVVASTHQTQAGVTSATDFKVSVFVQQADGSLAAPLQAPFPGFMMHTPNKGFVLADLNEDGLRDIVLGYGAGLHVFEGAASGQLVGRGVPAAATSVSAVVALDLNRDGHVDIATFDGFQIKVYAGDGQGGLQQAFAVSSWPVAEDNVNAHMAAGDLNGDGRLDLGLYDGSNVGAVFVQTETASFVRWPYSFDPYPSNYFTAMAVADFDGDGDHDFMLAARQTSMNQPLAKHVLYPQSGGQLAAPVRWNGFNVASAMLGVDMDGDGREDLLTVRTPANEIPSVGYARQKPEGGYETEVRFPLNRLMYAAPPRGLAAGDFTGDGCRDIAAVNGNELILFRAQCVVQMATGGRLPPELMVAPAAAASGALSADVASKPRRRQR